MEKEFNKWKSDHQLGDGANDRRRYMRRERHVERANYRRFRGRTLVQMIQDLESRGFPADCIDCETRAGLERFLAVVERGDLTPSSLMRAKANFAEDSGRTPDSVTIRSILMSRVPLFIWCMPSERLLQGKRNYASHYNRHVRSVHIQELFETVAGIHAWCNFTAIENEGSEMKTSTDLDREEKKGPDFAFIEKGSEWKVMIASLDREDLP